MKPFKEDWVSIGYEVALVTPGKNEARVFASFELDDPEDTNDEERARLAAQAPAMARLLYKIGPCENGKDVTFDEIRSVLKAAGVLP